MAGNGDYQLHNPTLDTQLSDTGTGFDKIWKVPYTVTSGPAMGTRGHVTVPAEQYDADTVHGLVQQAVATHQDVMGR
jgi:hypothetical protein